MKVSNITRGQFAEVTIHIEVSEKDVESFLRALSNRINMTATLNSYDIFMTDFRDFFRREYKVEYQRRARRLIYTEYHSEAYVTGHDARR